MDYRSLGPSFRAMVYLPMKYFEAGHMFKLANAIIYICLLFLGSYFIYQGNILQKYKDGKTYFAEYEEPITDLAVITSSVKVAKGQLRFGSDFNITYCAGFFCPPQNMVQLKKGKTRVGGLDVELEVKGIHEQIIRITPISTPLNIPICYVLDYTFSKKDTSATVATILTTKNNSHCAFGHSFWDGDRHEFSTNQGKLKVYRLNAEKYVYNPSVRKCRSKPYNELLLKEVLEEDRNDTTRLCIPQGFWTCSNDKKVRHISQCQNKSEENLFRGRMRAAEKNILKQACTQLQYKSSVLERTRNYPMNKAFLRILFDKNQVKVREEHPIYDFVAMVGAVGGTMGLCVGFSFQNVSTTLLDFLQIALKKIKWLKRTFPKSNDQMVVKSASGSTSDQSTDTTDSIRDDLQTMKATIEQNGRTLRAMMAKMKQMEEKSKIGSPCLDVQSISK